MDLDDIAYIKVKKPENSVNYYRFGLNDNTYAPSIMVRPEDVTIVKKSDLAHVSATPQWGYLSRDNRTICLGALGFVSEARQLPDGRWYNENIDRGDTIERDGEGKWRWTASPGEQCDQPNVWHCVVCAQPKVIECSCGYKTFHGLYVVSKLKPHEYQCIHRQQEDGFQCCNCKRQ